MPSKDTYYTLSISVRYLTNNDIQAQGNFEAVHLSELSIDNIKTYFPSIVAYHCAEIPLYKRITGDCAAV